MARTNIEVELIAIDKASKLVAAANKALKGLGKTVDEAAKKERAQAKETERLAKTFGTAEFKTRALEKAEKNLARTQLAAAIRKQEKALEATAIAAGKLTRATSRYNREAKKTERQNRKTKSSFSKLGTAAMKAFFIYETGLRIGRIAMRLMIAPIADAIKSFTAFEKGMAEVGTLLGKDIGEKGQKAVMGLTDTVKDLAIEFGKAPVDMAKALYFAVSAGATSAADAQKVLRASTMLATAGLVDAETSTKALVTVMNAFGIAYNKAEAVSDQFFVTVQKGITTVKELANKIGRVAGMAGAAGMSLQTMFAFIAAGTKVTGLTTATVTGLRSAIQLILKPGKQAKEVFDRLKISYGQNAIAGEGLAKLVRTLRNRLRGLGKGSKITATDISMMIPNMRASAVIMALLKSETDEFTKTLNVLNDTTKTTGATQAAVAKIMETFAFKMEKLKSSFEVVKIEFGGNFVEVMEFGSVLEGMSASLLDIFEAFKELKKEKDLGGLDSAKKTMEELGESLMFIAFDVGLAVIKFMGQVTVWLADLRTSVAWGKSILTGQSVATVSDRDVKEFRLALQRARGDMGDLEGLPLSGLPGAKGLIGFTRKYTMELSNLGDKSAGLTMIQGKLADRLKSVKEEYRELGGSTKDAVGFLGAHRDETERLERSLLKLDAAGKTPFDRRWSAAGGETNNKEYEDTVKRLKALKAAMKEEIKTSSGGNRQRMLLLTQLQKLGDALSFVTKRMDVLKAHKGTLDLFKAASNEAETLEKGVDELAEKWQKLQQIVYEKRAARKAGAGDTSGIKAVIEADALGKTITTNETNANKASKKLSAAKTDALVLEYTYRWRAFLEYTNKVKAAEEKAMKTTAGFIPGITAVTGRPMVRTRASARHEGQRGVQERAEMPGPDIAMTKTMLMAAAGWYKDYAKGTMAYAEIQAAFIINATKGFTDEKRKAFIRALKVAERTLEREAALSKKLSADKLAALNKEYSANASLRQQVVDDAKIRMNEELAIIEKGGTKGAQKQQEITASKALVLTEFTSKLKDMQKDAAEGIQIAIKFHVTDEDKLVEEYNKSVKLQYAAVLEAAALYQEQLQLLKGMNLTETEMDLTRFKIKKDIETALADHKLKETRRGFAIVEKEEKRSDRANEKTSKNALKYTRKAIRGFKSLTESLMADMEDAEVSTLQAWKNMGDAAFKMVTDALFEFALAEGLKQMFAKETAAVKIIADTSAATVEATTTAASAALGEKKAIKAVSEKAVESAANVTESVSELGWWAIPAALAAGAAMFAAVMYFTGNIKGYASGGLITGGIPGVDSVPIMAQQGEYVLPRNVVDSIRAGTPPGAPMGGYARGGMVRPQFGMPAFAGMPQQPTNVTVFSPNINTIALPNSAQNQRYYRDTVVRTRRNLNRNGYGV